MRLHTYVLYLIIISFLTGCILIRPKQPPCPEWTKTPPQADSTYFYAIGIGESQTVAMARNLARTRATASMADAIKAHIQSVHKEILSMMDSSDFSDFPPDFPEGPIIFDHPTPTWGDLTASVSRFVEDCTERDKEKFRVYALARASIPEFYEDFLEWVRPLVSIEYYQLLATFLRERTSG